MSHRARRGSELVKRNDDVPSRWPPLAHFERSLRFFARAPCCAVFLIVGCHYCADQLCGTTCAGSADASAERPSSEMPADVPGSLARDTSDASITYCHPESLILHPTGMSQHEPCRNTLCGQESGGAFAMAYCVEPVHWAVCSIANEQNLNPFDPDHGNAGILEVTFCVDAPIHGSVVLWYGQYPSRKSLVLLLEPWGDADASTPASCHVRHFTPEDACIATFDRNAMTEEDRARALPQVCSGLCGKTRPECAVDFGRTLLSLSAEPPRSRSEATVRVQSVKYFPSPCLCAAAATCVGPEPVLCRRDDDAFCFADRSACRRGVCVSGGPEDCGGMVGRYREGWIPGSSDAFVTAYRALYPRLGCPFDNNGRGIYVHEARGVYLQEYVQPDPSLRTSDDGQSALVLNPERQVAYLLVAEFWNAYQCLRDGGQAMAGAALLGPPLEEAQLAAGVFQQRFAHGWMALDTDSEGRRLATVYLDAGRTLDADMTSACQGVLAGANSLSTTGGSFRRGPWPDGTGD